MRHRAVLLLALAFAMLPAHAEQVDPLPVIESLMLAQRTRPDVAQFERAARSAEAAVAQTPGDARAWTLLAWVRMIEHRFSDALALAKRAEALAPDNARVLALMSDALVELGRYDEAVSVTQHLADVAPGIPAWIRAAHLRFLFDDADGAIQLMAMAARAGAARGEASAWIWLDLARLYLAAGNLAAAGAAIAAAERANPGLPGLLSSQAQLKRAQGDRRAALDLYRQALSARPSAEDAVAAWRLARQLGQDGAAKHHAALLEGLAKLDVGGLSRRALAEYFAESGQSQRALGLARDELAARPDIYSHATLARVLQQAGDALQARQHARAALALNTPDPQLRDDMHAILTAAPAPGAQAQR